MELKVLSITQITEYIRSMMDGDRLLCSVAVKGEISNYKVYPSGHHYFTIKDENAALKCVMFRGNAMKLRFRPDNGMKVIVLGKISVYPRDGSYQMYCNTMTPDGVGDLHTAFEQLKAKLSAQGLFDPVHKKPIPKYPGVIGIVTSPAGAAIHDMLRILRKRYPLSMVRLFPVRVQGAEAPAEIAAAIAYANAHRLADLLIVGRGGGSIEDLWAFNDELVAGAVFASEIPVISAVGHEPDVTICDYVADLRAATPSNAAELAVPDQDALRQSLDAASLAICTAMERQLKFARQQLRNYAQSPCMQGPQGYIEQKRVSLKHTADRLLLVHSKAVNTRRNRYISLAAKLDAMSPLKVLTRGYSVTMKNDGTVVSGISQLKPGENVSVKVSDGSFNATVLDITEGEQ